MSDELLEKIDQKLEILVKLTAINLRPELTVTQKIRLLSKVGLKPKEIAELLGTTANVVSVRLTEMRKEMKR